MGSTALTPDLISDQTPLPTGTPEELAGPLVFSSIWLHYFQFGPIEWCWRSLTYWKRQPMRRSLQPTT